MNASPTSPHPRRVLVAVDGSPASLEAVRYGRRMAIFVGGEMTLVTAWQPLRHGILPPSSLHPQRAAEQLIADCVREAFHGSTLPEYETETIEGDPAAGLIELSEGAEMLVIGSRGHTGLAGALLGSVSGACAAKAHCPVLVVHGPTKPATHPVDATVPTTGRMVVTF